MQKPSWFEFKNQTETSADLYMYGDVGGFGTSASDFISALSSMKGAHVNLHINSPGGSVFEGNAIFNVLKNHPGGVTTYIDGIAASMASVIAMAGSPVKIASNAYLMIHNPWASFSGDAKEMRQEADVLEKLKEGLVKIYSTKSGQTPEQISAAMDQETWFDAEEAIAFGFADEIYDGLEAVAKVDVSKFSKAPNALKMRMAAASDMTMAVDLDGTLAEDTGWHGISHIGKPVEAMLSKVKEWISMGKKVIIFTARASDPAAIPYIEKWLEENGIGGLEVTNIKSPAINEIWDNIAVRVEKNTGKRIGKIMENQNAESISSDPVDALKVEVTVEVSESTQQDPSAPDQQMPDQPAEPDPNQPMPDSPSVIMAEAKIDFAAKLMELSAAVESLKTQIAERDVALNAAKAEAQISAGKINAAAVKLISASGHSPVSFTSGEPNCAPNVDLLKQYNELRQSGDSARWLDFLKTNRAELARLSK